MILLSCPGCKKKLSVGDQLAGRLVLCPGCRGKVRVPQPEPAVESLEEVEELEEVEAEPPPPRKTGIKPAAAQEDRPRRRPPDDDYDDDRPRRRRVPKPRRRKLKSEQGGGIFSEGIFGMEVFTVVMIALAVLSLPLLALSFIPVYGALFALLALGLGGMMSLVGGVWLLIAAFSEDSTTGFLCLFVPLYFIYFALTEFDVCRKPIMVYGLGLILIFGASCAVRTWAGDGPGGPPRRFGALPEARLAYTFAGR